MTEIAETRCTGHRPLGERIHPRRPGPAPAHGRDTARLEAIPLAGANSPQRIVDYYSEAGPDYGAWSPGFHMHFGYFRRGIGPLAREPMLEEMTRQVLARLELPATDSVRLLDAGCGLGASTRLAARLFPAARIDGVTLVPWQVEQAHRLSRGDGLAERVRFLQADFSACPYADRSFDGAFAIESACHARGFAKEEFIRETARLLAPGARLVLADGFLKRRGPFNPLLAACLRTACGYWALDTFAELAAFRAALLRHGFEDVRFEEISWRVAASALHIPWVTLRFLAGELRRGLRLGPTRWGHLAACLVAPVIGMARRTFGYYLVTATRR